MPVTSSDSTLPDSFPDPSIDYRKHPDQYRIGRGEQGVLTVQPYKGELLPLWRFKTPAEATQSSQALLEKFEAYKAKADFVGMDMARKFIQMGFTRARRYARHRSGRKYADDGKTELSLETDADKAKSAEIFHKVLEHVRRDERYLALKAEHQQRVKAAKSGSSRARAARG